eukprot:TRINITY_DN17825_c0_g4_i1.p1 TRINITY_DN17825_c0_g4~~TRINITY_DN17825_c0_g4_i1.p1  ORF type:complete len:678 (+),score=185.26 TRINITY_DN17825_c0_g4_i1:177-2210(+)
MTIVDLQCVDQQLQSIWVAMYIGLGYFTSFVGAFVALTTMTYARQCMDGTKQWAYWLFVTSAGISLGGSSIWTMHFVGMQALELVTCAGTPVAKVFNGALSGISLVAAMFCTTVAMHLVMPTYLLGESAQKNKKPGEKKKDNKIRLRICGKTIPIEKFNIPRFIVSSIFLTIAACIMHYMGMVAQYGPYIMTYDPVIITISAIIALVAATAGLFIVVQIAAIGDLGSMGLRLASSALIGLAVNGMHYTGMQAATYTYTGSVEDAFTHGFGDNFQVNSLMVVIISLSVDVFQLSMCQHFNATLYATLQVAHKFATAKLPDNVQQVLEDVHKQVKPQDAGSLADYIPELTKANPEHFGIALCDTDGNMYTVGDVDIPFTIQSSCKPMLYILSMMEHGLAHVQTKIGEEPSGQPFDALSIDPTNRAFNPYVNAGAITSMSMFNGSATERYAHYERFCKDMSANPEKLKLNEEVYKSEMATNTNNRGIAAELKKRDILTGDKDVALDAYTMACSMDTTAVEAAVMGACLANSGKNPLTKKEVLPADLVNQMVTVMMSCGMYNGAGKWIVDVGIPAKSGVGGLLMCVVPGVCGIGIFSPRLDVNGNSHRGVLVATAMSKALGLHVLKKDKKGKKDDKKDDKKEATSPKEQPSTGARMIKVKPSMEELPCEPVVCSAPAKAWA